MGIFFIEYLKIIKLKSLIFYYYDVFVIVNGVSDKSFFLLGSVVFIFVFGFWSVFYIFF